MHVVLPFTRVEPEVRAAVEATGWGAHVVPRFVGGSDRAYYDLLAELWASGETFAIIEHDIAVHPTALDELAECPHEWCGFPHEYMDCGVQYGMGCVKFEGSFTRRLPDVMIRVGVMSNDSHPPRHWCLLDAWLQGVLLPSRGESKHLHPEPVRHLGTGSSHDCR